MGNISKQIEKINYCILHRPDLIPTLYKDTSIQKGLLYSRLRRAVPHRVGIEFEGYGSFVRPYMNDHHKDIKGDHSSKCLFIKNFFNLKDFDEDEFRSIEFQHNDNQQQLINLTEVRVSIENFTQLKGLFDILTYMKEYLVIPTGGGIHIHIDLHDYWSDNNKLIAINWMTKHLSKVESIFPKYEGEYNLRCVGDCTKKSYVNFSYHKSIEFRIAPLTYTYSTLIKWILGCEKLVSELINTCHLQSCKESNNLNNNQNPFVDNDTSVNRIIWDAGTGSTWISYASPLRYMDITSSYIQSTDLGFGNSSDYSSGGI